MAGVAATISVSGNQYCKWSRPTTAIEGSSFNWSTCCSSIASTNARTFALPALNELITFVRTKPSCHANSTVRPAAAAAVGIQGRRGQRRTTNVIA